MTTPEQPPMGGGDSAAVPPMPPPSMPPPAMPPPPMSSAPADPLSAAVGGAAAAPPAPAPPPPTGEDGSAALLSVACKSCGSQMTYKPGTTMLKCRGVRRRAGDREHRDDRRALLRRWASQPEKRVATIGKQVCKCQSCGATTETDELSGACQFCGGVLLPVSQPEGLIAPEAVLPFGIVKKDANDCVRQVGEVALVRAERAEEGRVDRGDQGHLRPALDV